MTEIFAIPLYKIIEKKKSHVNCHFIAELNIIVYRMHYLKICSTLGAEVGIIRKVSST